MKNDKPHSLPFAIRVYPQPDTPNKREKPKKSKRHWRCPEAMLVYDTECRVDETQALTFGSYRCLIAGKCVAEGIFYADDLPQRERRVIEDYVKAHRAEKLRLLTRCQFVDEIFKKAYKGRWLLIAFNWPFDIARVAIDFTNARGRFAGGFSMDLWDYSDEDGNERRDQHRPAICIKHIDSKRALKGFTARKNPDRVDLIPEGSESGKPKQGYIFRGNFLDLRTLAFALTDKGHSLDSASEAFLGKPGKKHVERHGIITEEYIDYNRQDVSTTCDLAIKLLEEYAKHPIALQVTKAYSPASIGKAYLRAMGIKPVLARQPEFPKEYLGYAETAFFGGRASAHIRKIPVPVVYTDFLSMYTTVNSLMDLWRFVTARKIKVVEHCRAEIELFLQKLIDCEFSELFNQETWKELPAFVKIIPDGDILPSRAKYSQESNDWQVAVNHIYARNMESKDCALWYSLPDVIASTLLTGRMPKIVDAFRIEPVGTLPGLKPTELLGKIGTDPKKQDFFKVVIEERMRLSTHEDISETEKKRLKKALKVLASAASYGIYAEMNRQESDDKVLTTCHGIDAEPFQCVVQHPDIPGEYCFPPLASLITGAARLMLALLENCVRELGGTYAMEDTDSMALLATENGGLIPCPGGPYRTKNRDAVKALSWKQVKQISDRFAKLKPYNHDAVPGSILKIEEDNFDPKTKQQRQIYCYAISAKRYALYLIDQNGEPDLLRGPRKKDQNDNSAPPRQEPNNEEDRWSEHGLGHLLNPIDPENRDWISHVWLNIIRKELKLPIEKLDFENLPAVGRVAVGSPGALRPLAHLNLGKKYRDQVKPFNFLLTCHVKQLGHPIDCNPERFHLIAPYQSNPKKWPGMEWIDQYSGNHFGITTAGYPNEQTALVKTYGDVLREYEFHPESKCADARGEACDKQTVGLLKRLHVRILKTTYIGKESNKIEDVASALVHSAQEVYTEYPDPRRDEWESAIRLALNKVQPERVAEMTGLALRTIIYARTGRKRPHPEHQQLIAKSLRKLGLI